MFLGAHKGKYKATLRKVFSFLDSDGLKVFKKACRFFGATQLNEGSNSKNGRVRDPFNQKDLAKRQVHVGSAMRKVLIARE